MSQVFEFNLNMDKVKRDPNIVYARVGDTESISIVAHIYNGEDEYTPEGVNAYFECICPNGSNVRQEASLASNVVTYVVDSGVLQAPGVINVAYFRFENGTTESPTYVESTEPFVIIVLSGIDDNIDAGDYIAEWRSLQEQLNNIVDYAEKALPSIQDSVNSVTSAASEAITSINNNKEEVEQAASNVMVPITNAINDMQKQVDNVIDTFDTNSSSAISTFNSNGQNAINAFNSNGSSAISKFNYNGSSAINKINSDGKVILELVNDDMEQLEKSVQDNITDLDVATQKAIDAMEAALSEDQYGDILNRLSRDWKLSYSDMTVIPPNSNLDNLTLGTYSRDSSSAVTNSPVTTSFVLFAGSFTETSQYQLLVAPEDVNAEYIRFRNGTKSGDNVTWGSWSQWVTVGEKVSYPIPISKGGTGSETAEAARKAIGAGTSDFSGDYNDLTNKPIIPTVPSIPISIENGGTGATTADQARLNIGAGTSNFSGNYEDLIGKPAIPTVPDLPLAIENGGTGSSTAEQARIAIGAGTSNFSGNYNDLTNKPSIPSIPVSVANGGTGSSSAANARTNLSALGTSNIIAGTGIAVSVNGLNVTISLDSSSQGLDLATAVKNALEALTEEPSMIVNLASTSYADVFEENPSPGVTGTLPIVRGGTGITSNPSLLVNLASTSSASVFASSPRPGVTGTLPVARGGTGVTSLSSFVSSITSYLDLSDFGVYAGSKVISNSINWVTLFSSSQYRSIVGRSFNQSTDVVIVMNGDADAAQEDWYLCTYRPSTSNVGFRRGGTAGTIRANYLIIAP